MRFRHVAPQVLQNMSDAWVDLKNKKTINLMSLKLLNYSQAENIWYKDMV